LYAIGDVANEVKESFFLGRMAGLQGGSALGPLADGMKPTGGRLFSIFKIFK
jgi:hypothetical protein